MSTTIDSRVVEMRFDNKQFESNVATTMSTLDKLKRALHLDGASKGLENVGSAADTVSVKFNAMWTVADQTLRRITDSAITTGKNLVKSLSVDQIMSGWNKYGQKTTSVQTIMNATGLSIDEVNGYLDKLMWFSDETSYSFTDMTAALGQMTSAGGDIKTLIPLITGVANATAFAGKGAAEFSRVMFNLNQSYSKGYLDYSDWKSIDLAGVSSKQLKQMIIDVAVAKGAIKEGEVTLSNFASTLKDKWADTSVMEAAFGKFAEMSEKAYEMVQSGEVDTASEAYEILAKQYDGIAITAAKAAQEAKTFSEAIDATKDAVSSGWMRTFEIIFGNYDEAKKQWTDLANVLWDMFASGSEGRNAFLGEVFDSNWDKLKAELKSANIGIDKFETSIEKIIGIDKASQLADEYGSLADAIQNGAVSSEDLKKALKDVVNSGLTGIVDGLNEIDRVLRRGNKGEDVKKMQAALKELGYDLGKFGENADGLDGSLGPVTQKAIKEFQKAHGLVVDGIAGPKTMKALKEAAKGIEKTVDNVDELMESCDSLLDVITNKSGRQLLFESLLNILQAIQRPINAVKEAFSNVFSLTPTNLYNGLKRLNRFTKSLISGGILDEDTWDGLTKKINSAGIETGDFMDALTSALKDNDVNVDELIEKYGSLSKAFEDGAISTELIRDVLLSFDGVSETLVDSGRTLDNLRRIFEGLFAAIDAVVTILKVPFKIVFDTITKVLKLFGLTFLDVFADVGDHLVTFRDAVDTVVDGLTTFISEHVAKWIEKFKETEFFKTVAGWFKDAGDSMSTAVGSVTDKLNNFKVSGFGKGLMTVVGFFTTIAKKIGESEIFKTFVDGITTAFGKLKNFFSGFKLPKFNLDNVQTFLTEFINLGDKIQANKNGGLSGVLMGVGRHLDTKPFFKTIGQFPLKAFEKLANFWVKTGDLLKKAFEKGKEIAVAIKEFLFGTQDVNLQVIMDTVTKFLWIVTLIKTIQFLSTMVSPLANVTDALNNFATSLKWDAISGAFKSLALALAAFTICIVVIASMPDMNKAWQAAGMLAGLMIIMGLVVTAMGIIAGKFKGGMDAAGAAFSLLALMGSLVLLVYAIKEIEKLTIKDPEKTFSVLFGALLAMTAGVWMVSKAGGSSFKSVAAILTLLGSLKLLLEIITAYDEYDWSGKQRAIKKMMQMLLGLSVAIAIASGGPKAGGNAKGLAFTILAMVLSLKLILDAIEEFAKMDPETLEKGGPVVAAILGALTFMAWALSRANKGNVLEKGQKSVNNFTGMAVALLAVVAAVWLFGKMDPDTLVQGGIATASALVLFAIILSSVGKACKGIKTGSIVVMLAGMGLLIVGMYHIIKQMQDMPIESTLSSAGALAGLMLAMAATLRIITKHNYGAKRIYKWVGALAALTVLVAILAFALYSIKGMNPANAIGNAVALGILLGVMALVLKNLVPVIAGFDSRKLTYKKMAKIGTILAGLTVVLYALVGVLALMNGVGGTNAISNALALSVLLAVLVEVAKHLIPAMTAFDSRKLSYQKMAKIGVMLLGLTVVLYALVGVLALMNGVNGLNSIGNAVALGLLLSVLAGVMVVLEKFNVKFNGGAVAAIAILSAVLFVLVGVLYSMENIDPVATLPRILALAALLAAVVAVTVILEKFKVGFNGGAVAAIAILSAVLYELVGVLYLLQYVNPEGLLPKVGALSALLAVLAGVMVVLNAFKVKFNGGAVAAMALLALVLGELAGVMILANYIDTDGALTRVKALSALLAVIAGVLLVLNTFKVKFNGGAVAAMALLALVMAELAGVMIIANKIDAEGAITRVKALSILIGVLTLLLIPLTLIGALPAQVFIGIGALATIMASLLILVGVLALMDGLENATANAKALSLLATVLTLLLIPLTLVGALVAPAFIGIGALATMMASLLILVGILALMDGLKNAQENTKLIIELLAALTTTLIVVSVLGPLAAIGVGVLTALTAIVGKMALFIIAIGALMEYFPQIKKFVGNGLELLKKLFNGVGELISAFGVGLTSGLPKMGENLSKFGENLGGFITAMKSVDSSVVDNAATLMTAVSTLTKSDFLDGLNNLLEFGNEESSLEILGKELSGFATNAGDFITKMGDMKPETATSIESFCSAIESLNAVCGNNNLGDGKLTSMGTTMEGFATSMKNVAESLSDLTDDDVANIKRAAEAGEALAALNECIPKSGGLWQDIAGEANLETWGKKISAFADSLIAYSIKVSGKSIDKTAIENSAAAATPIADLNEKIPKTGGVWQDIAGESDIADWGRSLVSFGSSLVTYSTTITKDGGIDNQAIKDSAGAVGAVVEVANKIEGNKSVLWGMWSEEKDLEGFGNGLTSLGDGLLSYATKAVELQSIGTEPITHTGTILDEIVKVCEKVPRIGATIGDAFNLLGVEDPKVFGDGLYALADGLHRFCAKAVTINDLGDRAKTGIETVSTRIEEIIAVVKKIPDDIDNMNSSVKLHTAVSNIQGVCRMINEITTAGYDYSGISSIGTEVIDKLKSLITDTSVTTLESDMKTLKTATGHVKDVCDNVQYLNDKTYGGVKILKDALKDLSEAKVQAVIDTFSGKATSVSNAVSSVVTALSEGLEGTSGQTQVTNAMIALIDTCIIDKITSYEDDLHTAGTTLATKLANGMVKMKSLASEAGKAVGNMAALGARVNWITMYGSGGYLGEGLVAGIEAKWGDAYSAGYSLGQKAVQGEKDGQKSKSPSKLTFQAGKWLGEGLILGMEHMGGSVYKAGSSMGQNAIGSISNSISRISDLVSSDIDSQPTIRPVLDLSDVQSGAAALGSMLDMNSSVGVHANLGAISSMMSTRSQNGGNAEVVAAIDKLNKRMDNLGNTTYQINGITYDDGSNINDAVATLVRAARIERRV